MDWDDFSVELAETIRADMLFPACATQLPAQVPTEPSPSSELEHLLEIDQPTVVECLQAEEQAQQAIKEVAAKDQASEKSKKPNPSPKPGSLKAENQRSVSS